MVARSVPHASVYLQAAASSNANTSSDVDQQRRLASHKINAIRIEAEVYHSCRTTAYRSPTGSLLRKDYDLATEAPAEQVLATMPGPSQHMFVVSQVSKIVQTISYAQALRS